MINSFHEFNVFECRKSSVGMLGITVKLTGHEIRKRRIIDKSKNTFLVENEIPTNLREDLK